MAENEKHLSINETLDAFSRASLMRGITLDGLRRYPESLTALIDVSVFYLLMHKREGANGMTREEVLANLSTFLNSEGSWLTASAEELLAVLEEKKGFSKRGAPVFIRPARNISWEDVKAYLERERLKREEESQKRRTELQEKNRAVNSPDTPEENREVDERYMREALKEAKKALEMGEVPVGAVIVSKEGRVLSCAFNRVIAEHDATSHAEILAIRAASKELKTERLSGATLYVTLEPCPMCATAAAFARIRRIVWGADDRKAGACGGASKIDETFDLSWKFFYTKGILKNECERLLKDFFTNKRLENKTSK